ncbi:G-D-S-L family lipolytic protein [Subsaximicrobium wynnwilliamsii]|uniref:G-D-S-L family lipolytic protein n=2 Tax=Subsaximicrobium wynnwilliamsii TaxID=291179 RepID=A0A5C6ZEK2_9FLAO|nr:G-D-S-L family lipolytic protein [Subsaximicrobium wynnwilliamsii]TXD88238.1 G-D-S-L family lipolytic protein [Subsaximicrobium wynnwilliamsii]TXE02253.1 G-D-S-L family lipolytic protein [Subsaximicrobium wynnwilliamsii]
MKLNNIWLLAILLIGFTACESDDDSLSDPLIPETQTAPSPVYTSGTADFTTFVAVGNSLTAGFSDGTLFMRGQEASFPNILAQQFALAGGGNFTQPLINDNVGGLLLAGTQIAGPRLIFNPASQTPGPVSGTPTTDITNVISGPFNNMGVPGAKSSDLLETGYGNIANLVSETANPYFIRMASTPNASVLQDALAQNPTFFSLWIGNNDVLGYAASGGESNIDSPDYDPITDQATFDGAMNAIVASLATNTPNGIIANIPNVTDAPYFTTVPFAPLSPADPDFGPQIPTLNGIFGQLNQVFAFLESQGIPNATDRQIVFSQTAASAVVIKDESLMDLSAQIEAVLNASPTFPAFVQSFGLPAAAAPIVANLFGAVYGQARQANANDLLVLPSSSIIGTVNEAQADFLQASGLPEALANQFAVEGVSLPLADKWVVIPTELTEIQNATAAFNQTINNLATQYDLAFFDVNTFFGGVASNGFQAGSAFLTADYVTGGTFSLDGVHPSPRGYAVIANQMIGLINTKYGSNLPTVNPIDYTGLYIN